MFRKLTLSLFHGKKIGESVCGKKYPWGWKSKSKVYQLEKLLATESSINFFIDQSIEQTFNESDFLHESVMAYNVIYKAYLNKEDFLDFEYTTPKLSIALNDLRRNIRCDLLKNHPKEIDVKQVKILSKNIKNELTTNNFKICGYFDNRDITKQISIGMIGPEIRHLWDQIPVKQVVNVSYTSETFHDILEWERDLTIENPEWQVSNINGIHLHQRVTP